MGMNNKHHRLVLFAAFALSSGTLLAQTQNRIHGLVVHEWGTFTSFQGGDGVLQPWRPLVTSQLPSFVYNWNRPGLNRQPAGALAAQFGLKSVVTSLQRMET